MQKMTVPVILREGKGKGAARKLRASGSIPAVVYGGEKNMDLAIAKTEIRKVLASAHHMALFITLELPDKNKQDTVLKELQLHPVTDEVLHIDFVEVLPNKPLRMKIEVELEGTPAGLREGGIFHHGISQVMVEALPKDMPDCIKVDVSKLMMGESIHISDLISSDDIKLIYKSNEVVASVLSPHIKEAETGEAAAGATAEPELVEKKGKAETPKK